jgi:hypothetical protein
MKNSKKRAVSSLSSAIALQLLKVFFKNKKKRRQMKKRGIYIF